MKIKMPQFNTFPVGGNHCRRQNNRARRRPWQGHRVNKGVQVSRYPQVQAQLVAYLGQPAAMAGPTWP
jgi:hypothetical protein